MRWHLVVFGLLVSASTAFGQAVPPACKPLPIEGLATARSQASVIELRRLDGNTVSVAVAPDQADGLAPGAWIKLEHGAGCPPVTTIEIHGGSLAGEVIERAEDGSRLLLTTAGTPAPGPNWTLGTALARAARSPMHSQVSLVVEIDLRDLVKTVAPGDRVSVGYHCQVQCAHGPIADARLRRLSWQRFPVDRFVAVATLLASALFLMLVVALVVRDAPWRLAAGGRRGQPLQHIQVPDPAVVLGRTQRVLGS